MDICTADFTTFMNTTIMPITALASVITAVTIGLGYMIGQFLGNAKATTWAKTEVVQIVMSIASVTFIIILLNSFCAINMEGIKSIFNINPAENLPCGSAPAGSTSLYAGALDYIKSAACFCHSAMSVVRYHLEAYTVLSNLNLFECSLSTGGIGWGCLFGYSGTYQQPLGGYGAVMSALNVIFNSSMVSYISSLNFLFILLFVYKGFVLFFLPLGVFLRSMPYLRTFGSLLISVALAFFVVYPLLLAIFGLMGDGIFAVPEGLNVSKYDESVFESTTQAAGIVTGHPEFVRDTYFDGGREKPIEAIEYASAALVAGVFLPTAALLATIASVRLIAKILGEEIDLSRIVQMV